MKSKWKIVRGSGKFEQDMAEALLQEYKKRAMSNPYLLILAQTFADYAGYLDMNSCEMDSSEEGGDGEISFDEKSLNGRAEMKKKQFFDSYTMKKKILLKVHAILKARLLTSIEIIYKVRNIKNAET